MYSILGQLINSILKLLATLVLITKNQQLCYSFLYKKYGLVVKVFSNKLNFISVKARDKICGLKTSYLFQDFSWKMIFFFRDRYLELIDPNLNFIIIIQKLSKYKEKSSFF